MKTLHAYFGHYYKNCPISMYLSLVLKKKTKTGKAMSFGMVSGMALSVLSPQAFVNTHRHIPTFSDLPKDIQEHILKMDNKMNTFQDYFQQSKLDKKMEKFLETENAGEIEKILLEIGKMWDEFMVTLRELEKFKEIY